MLYSTPVRAPLGATLTSPPLRSNHKLRDGLAVLTFVILALASAPSMAQASEPLEVLAAPQEIGARVPVNTAVQLSFEQPMDPQSVADGLGMSPNDTSILLYWEPDSRSAWISATTSWQVEQKYLITVPVGTLRADGTALEERLVFMFTTQLAPRLNGYEVKTASNGRIVPPADLTSEKLLQLFDAELSNLDWTSVTSTSNDVSRNTNIRLKFTSLMNQSDTEEHFKLSPDVAGELSWEGNNLTFTPNEPLTPGARYTASVVGAHDEYGNILVDQAAVSFTVREEATVVKTSPKSGEQDVQLNELTVAFSQPMNQTAVNESFALLDPTSNLFVAGELEWDEQSLVLTYTPEGPLIAGRKYELLLRDGTQDVDGNAFTYQQHFTTKAPPPSPTPAPALSAPATPVVTAPRAAPVAAPASSLGGYALNQINAARAAYGFAPLYLDNAISGVAQAHANDQLANGYYSHTSRNGASLQQRLAAAGISVGMASENQCHYYSGDATWVLNWCHNAFMAEPYPGQWNHIANILNPNWTRVGVGVASNGSHTIITWDFAN